MRKMLIRTEEDVVQIYAYPILAFIPDMHKSRR